MADVDELRLLSGLLDQVLALPAGERDAWLATLDGQAAALVPTLRELLYRAASRETAELLDRGPAFAPPDEGPAPLAWHAGDAVGPYRLLRPIGQGGMGDVWLAERGDGQLRRSVALKLPTLGLRRSVLVQRFARERDILAGLAHPNIARLYDAGLADDGQPYLALEYVDGQPITAYCDKHALTPRQRVQLQQQVMDAVQHAHANLVIHRDLKPSNVLVTAQGQAMLLDFGIAKLLHGDETQAQETELTQIGGRALTLDYAAPEQLSGAPVSIATDVWALGVLLHELLTGQRPFRGTRRELEQAILLQEPARLPGVEADLATIVLKALKKSPRERYATVNALAEDLGRWLRGEPVQAQPDSAWYRTRRFVARNKLGVLTASAVLATVLAASAVAVWQALVAREQTRVAQTEARTAAAVQDFLENIFRANSGDQADPIKARQRTAKELLDEGAARIDGALDDAPQAKLRVLQTLADMYADLWQQDDAARLHAKRVALLDQQPAAPGAELVTALAEWADALVAASSEDQAERAVARATDLLAHLAAAPEAARLKLDLARANLGAMGRRASAVADARRAVARLLPGPANKDLLRALEYLGDALVAEGQSAEARRVLQQAIALAPRAAGGGKSNLVTLHESLGEAELRLGNAAAAEQAFRQAMALADASAGPRSPQAAVARYAWGGSLGNLDRPREGTQVLDEALRIVEGWPAGTPERDAYWPVFVLLKARLATQSGRPDLALHHIGQAGALVERAERMPGWVVDWHAERAAALLDLGRIGEAEAALGAARDQQLKLPAEARDKLDLLALRILQEQSRPDAAEDLWRRLWSTGPAEGRSRGELMAARAEIALMRGRCQDARQAASEALSTLGEGAAPSVLARLQGAQGRALLCLGRHPEAVAALRASVATWMQIHDREFSPVIAAARLVLARALRHAGADAEARHLVARVQASMAASPAAFAALQPDLRAAQRELGLPPRR